ncbi:MAG: M48 family metalloprotease, partial [Thermodesulfobacteriota bacterium]|nr:M48 family metalloprotease [Thermodesulfobacteriota bacterium]
MNKEIWKVIFEGKLFEGHKPDIVKKRLASLINIDPVKIERLFQEGQVILKSGIDYQSALKFQAAFQRTGARCRVIQIEEASLEPEKSIETTSPGKESFKRDTPSTYPHLSTDKVLGAFRGDIDSVQVSRSYKIALSIASISTMLLPFLYIALIIMTGWGIFYHAVENINVIIQMGIWGKLAFLSFAYLTPLVFGTMLFLFMFKPFLAPHPTKAMAISLNPYKEGVLFDLVHRISEIVGSPMPRRIEIDCNVHSSASFDIGLISLFEEDIVLKFGLPLAAGLNTRQFAGVLAHELGHFSRIDGNRLTFIIRSINLWFSRIVYDRDIWDEKIKKWSEEGNVGIRILCNMARFFGGMVRKIMWIFMKTGYLISYRLIRKMEFNADRFQTRIAGSKQFADTCLRLDTMVMASEKTFADFRKLWEGRPLVNDLPALIILNSDKNPPLTEPHIRRHIMESKTGLFDALPSARDRIISAFDKNTEGIFSLDVPGRLLFSDFDKLSREATIHYYRNEMGLTVTDNDLIAPHAFTVNEDDV